MLDLPLLEEIVGSCKVRADLCADAQHAPHPTHFCSSMFTNHALLAIDPVVAPRVRVACTCLGLISSLLLILGARRRGPPHLQSGGAPVNCEGVVCAFSASVTSAIGNVSCKPPLFSVRIYFVSSSTTSRNGVFPHSMTGHYQRKDRGGSAPQVDLSGPARCKGMLPPRLRRMYLFPLSMPRAHAHAH